MNKQFTQPAWVKNLNIYEVNIRQYTPQGTFLAFIPHIERLKEMGVKMIWLMPITPIATMKRQGSLGSYYACSSYTSVNPEYGSLSDFEALVTAVHNAGMKIIIDWVANHTGWGHHWAKNYPHWYMHDEHGNFIEENNWQDVIDLNYAVPEMRLAMIDAMKSWVCNLDIDGFRCDMAHLVPLDFWQQARAACDEIKPLYWLAETEEWLYHEVFDTSYAWEWMHTSANIFQQKARLQNVYEVLKKYETYPEKATKLFFTSNHDENSWVGTATEKYGNTAQAWAVFCATWERSIPLIYSGQENGNEKRLPFFDKGVIDWVTPPPLQNFYTTLLHFRNNNIALITEGETIILCAEDKEICAYFRKHRETILLVLLNTSNFNRSKVNIQHKLLQGDFVNVFSFNQMLHTFSAAEDFELLAGEYLVYYKS